MSPCQPPSWRWLSRHPDSAARGLRLPGARSPGARHRGEGFKSRSQTQCSLWLFISLWFSRFFGHRSAYRHENPPVKCTYKIPPHSDRLWFPSCLGLGTGALGLEHSGRSVRVGSSVHGPCHPWSCIPGPAGTLASCSPGPAAHSSTWTAAGPRSAASSPTKAMPRGARQESRSIPTLHHACYPHLYPPPPPPLNLQGPGLQPLVDQGGKSSL